MGSLSGCASKSSDGTVVETEQVSAEQKTDVQAQYKKQILDRQSKSVKKGKATRRR